MVKNPTTFLKEVRVEMSKVSWLDQAQLVRFTLIVIGVSVAMAVYIGGLDFTFTKLAALIIK